MPWMPVDQQLVKHRKNLELARLLRKDPRYTAGLLLEVWSWAVDHAKDGFVDAEEDSHSLARSLMTRHSTATRWLLVLRTVGWIDDDWRFHEWDEWGGKVVREREKDALRKRLFREHKKGDHSLYIEGCPICVRGQSGGQKAPRPMDASGGQNGLRPVDRYQSSAERPGVEERRVDTPYPHGVDADTGWAERRAEELVASATPPPWHDTLAKLHERAVGEGAIQSFVTYFGDAHLEGRGEGYALLVPNALHQEHVTRRYRDQLVEGLGTDELVIEVRNGAQGSEGSS